MTVHHHIRQALAKERIDDLRREAPVRLNHLKRSVDCDAVLTAGTSHTRLGSNRWSGLKSASDGTSPLRSAAVSSGTASQP